jgi:hypothetical protein
MDLSDIAKDKQEELITIIKNNKFRGPYIKGEGIKIPNTQLPINPIFIYRGDKMTYIDHVVAHHWSYNSQTGIVKSAIQGKTMTGVYYRNL